MVIVMYEKVINFVTRTENLLKDAGEYGHEMEHMMGWDWNMMGGWGFIPMFLVGLAFLLIIGLSLYYLLSLDRRQNTTVIYAPPPPPVQPVTPVNTAPVVTSSANTFGQTKFCPTCGAAVPHDARFCPSCGNKV